jgi:thiol-disulfide isomerase/thioredoxin
MSKRWLLVTLSLSAVPTLACDEGADKKPVSAPLERSQVVEAKSPTAAATQPAVSKPTTPVVAKAPRVICGGQMTAPGRAVPKKPVSQAAAPGEEPLPESLLLGGGFTWVNFWAAWCAPCKEEIPRLLRFQEELAKVSPGFRLTFVSLDDDPRQLDAFLASQPAAGGVRRSYWLKEGKEREEWLKAAGLEADPELPFHLLFDNKSKLRCVVKGAVEDADLPAIRALVAP